MDDLISRRAAITLPVMPKEYREYQTFNLDDAYEQGWLDCQNCIEELPSAEPEPSQVARDIATIIENEKDMRVVLRNSVQPEIIHCKDCKHYKAYEYTGKLACHYIVGVTVESKLDDFCSRGERIPDGRD